MENTEVKKDNKSRKLKKEIYKKRHKLKNNNDSYISWFLSICVITFVLSLFFSYISAESIKNIPILPAILILLAIIFIGVLFDIIAIAVTIADESHFNAKASKKVKSAKTAILLIRNSHKVANFCADVIGDISGVLSGAISTLIALKIASTYGLSLNLEFLISALVASVTVGGKAIGRILAKSNSTEIVNKVSKLIHILKRKKK